MRGVLDPQRTPEGIALCRKALRGMDPAIIATALEADGDFGQRNKAHMRKALARLYAREVPSSVVAAGIGARMTVVQHHWRQLGLSARDRPRPDLPGETWKRLPGWRMDVSSAGRIRNLAGRHIKISPERGKLLVRYTGSDADPQEKRMFSVATLVLAAFRGEPLTRAAKHIDGDQMNCRLENLEPGDFVYHRSQGLRFEVEPDPAAVRTCRRVLSETDIPPRVVDAVLTHRGIRTREQWKDAERCIRALVAGEVNTRTIAQGMGVLTRIITARREKLGLGVAPRVLPEKRAGEIWRRVPGHKGMVSNLGRYVGAHGSLISGTISQGGGRPRVKITPLNGEPARTVMVASLVLSVWRGYPLLVPARHKNGDIIDCRLKNLEVGVQGARPGRKRSDGPWTRKQDNLLRKATSYAEAAALTGHSLAHTQKRMRLLGIEIVMEKGSRRGVSAPLEFRNLSALGQCVAVLQGDGIAERTINLGLNIIKQGRGEFALKNAAMDECIVALHGAGVPHRVIRAGCGLSIGVYHDRLERLGLKQPPTRPAGWRTKGGPIDYRESEEWRAAVGIDYLVSSEGRAATPDGYLLAQNLNQSGDPHVGIMLPDGKRTARLVARMVLEAFKPHLTTRTARHLNGDKTDNRVVNLVPREVTSAPVTQPARRTRGGNLSDTEGPITGSIPRAEPLWAQADAIVPRGLDQDVRGDLISEMVLLVMDGRAETIREAFGKARTAYNRMMGVWSETSLDAPLGDDHGARRIDMLTTGAEFLHTGQVRARHA